MRHFIFYKVLYECEAMDTEDAILSMAQETGITYDVVELCIMDVPSVFDAVPITHGWYTGIGNAAD